VPAARLSVAVGRPYRSTQRGGEVGEVALDKAEGDQAAARTRELVGGRQQTGVDPLQHAPVTDLQRDRPLWWAIDVRDQWVAFFGSRSSVMTTTASN